MSSPNQIVAGRIVAALEAKDILLPASMTGLCECRIPLRARSGYTLGELTPCFSGFIHS
jgi:hypothetical protein